MRKNKKSIGFVTGSRADYGLLEPLIKACQKEFNVELFVTGSHLSKQFGYTIKDVDYSDCELHVIDCLIDSDSAFAVTLSQSVGLSQFASAFKGIEIIDLLIVLGDRFEIVPPVLAAYNVGIPVVHIEGDDTSLGSLDEGYRGVIRSLATHHFTVEKYGSLGCVFPNVNPSDEYEVIIVYHPHINYSMEEYVNIVEATSGMWRLFIGSNSDSGGRLINNWIADNSCRPRNLSRTDYIAYLKGCKFIIGNSSSGIIEAPSLKVPSINVGDRQKGRKRAKSVINVDGSLVGLNGAINAVLAFRNQLDYTNPYYKPNTVKNMIKDLKEICS